VKILHVVGARPNFVKAAPVIESLESYSDVKQYLMHTGQHYDSSMSDVFFRDLDLRPPDINLATGLGTSIEQISNTMLAAEPYLKSISPDALVVYGDVNSTLALAIVGRNLGVPVIHVESGLRSFDMSMPEEVNRIIVDSISSLLLVTSEDAVENLTNEGRKLESIKFVGNTMIDSLEKYRHTLDPTNIMSDLHLESKYILVTFHRPSNVDDLNIIKKITDTISELSLAVPVVWPIHPRTQSKIEELKITLPPTVIKTSPLGYKDFLSLVSGAKLVITDSGGIQEETTVLGVPCITVRENTERPVTISLGTNQLSELHLFGSLAAEVIEQKPLKSYSIPPLWDGQAGLRSAKEIYDFTKTMMVV
jgi:UDP-N-acetylglucosamine 2-epimerase (non-hydrolysing)